MIRIPAKHGSAIPLLEAVNTEITLTQAIGATPLYFSLRERVFGEWTGRPRFRVKREFWPSLRAFVDELKRFGVEPRVEPCGSGASFAFWFRLSSRKNCAVYEIATEERGIEIHTSVYCSYLDQEIREKTLRLDNAMCSLLALCGVPLQSSTDNG